MADTKISALTDGGNLQSGDQVAIARSGTSYRAVPLMDGWIDDTAETWTYASGSGGGTATFTVSGDVRSKYPVGTRIKLTQTTVKYFVVSADPTFAGGNTTVTITAGSDYTLANAAITANYHSYDANPQGFPGSFAFTPGSVTGWSATPTVSRATFSVLGRICFVDIRVTGTSNATTVSMTAAIAGATTADGNAQAIGPVVAVDNGSSLGTPARGIIASNSSTITMSKDWSGAAWTNTGTKTVALTGSYRI